MDTHLVEGKFGEQALEAGAGESPARYEPRIAPDAVGEHEQPAGAEDSQAFAQRGAGVREKLEGFEARHRVEGPVRERQPLRRAPQPVISARPQRGLFSPVFQHPPRGFEIEDHAVERGLPQQGARDAPGPGGHVEHARRGHSDQRLQERLAEKFVLNRLVKFFDVLVARRDEVVQPDHHARAEVHALSDDEFPVEQKTEESEREEPEHVGVGAGEQGSR